MSLIQIVALVGTLVGIPALVLLLVRFSAPSTPAVTQQPTIPAQRSYVTQASLVKLNQAYGAGKIGDAEYTRRRKELLGQD